MSNQPHFLPLKVSVVMCTFNGNAFVRDQVNSIIAQTYPIYELLIFDDASTDNTVAIINQIADECDKVKITINKKNIGFIKNFEQAIKAGNGDVIAISDQDDVWKDSKIEKMINAWKPGYPLIYCNSFIFSKDLPTNPPNPVYKQFEGTDARKIFFRNTISGHAMIITKELVKLSVPFAEEIYYDWWLAVVAAYNGGVQHYNDVMVFHRSHATNITVKAMSKYNEAYQRYLNKKVLIKHARKFETAINIPEAHKNFLKQYLRLLEESLDVRFHTKLFWFMFKNRHYLFNYKKRKIGIISHLKHSYLNTVTEFDKIDVKKLGSS